MRRSPLFIKVALHFYYSPPGAAFPHPSEPADECQQILVREQMLIKGDDGFLRGTERLKAYVAMLGDTPFPGLAYVDPRTSTVVNPNP